MDSQIWLHISITFRILAEANVWVTLPEILI